MSNVIYLSLLSGVGLKSSSVFILRSLIRYS